MHRIDVRKTFRAIFCFHKIKDEMKREDQKVNNCNIIELIILPLTFSSRGKFEKKKYFQHRRDDEENEDIVVCEIKSSRFPFRR